jgi:hypothetical protein
MRRSVGLEVLSDEEIYQGNTEHLKYVNYGEHAVIIQMLLIIKAQFN